MITPRQERIERTIVWAILFYFVVIIAVWLRSVYQVPLAPAVHRIEIVAPARTGSLTNALFIQDAELATPGQYASDHQAELAKGGP
jgi:hypothetical protein